MAASDVISRRQSLGQRTRGCRLQEEVVRLEEELTSSEEGEVDTEDGPMRGPGDRLQGSGAMAVLSGQPGESYPCVSPVLSNVQCGVNSGSLGGWSAESVSGGALFQGYLSRWCR